MGFLLHLLSAGAPAPVISQKPRLHIYGFESNSGGQAKNVNPNPGTPDPSNYPTTQELSSTPNVRILNPTTLGFENMQIGVNENLDHFGLAPHTTHGWHLQTKNRMDAGTYLGRPTYVCEFGQGGSYSLEWVVGSTYHNKMIARYNAAFQGVIDETGEEPEVIMFNSWGINDAIAGTDPVVFRTRYFALLDYINNMHEVAAYMVDIPFNSIPNQAAYRAAISAMASMRPGKIFVQDMQGKQQDDIYHLGYKGMKAMTDEKINQVLQIISG